VSSSSPAPRQYRALAQVAAKRRRIGYRAAKAQDQVTAIGEYRAALDLIRELAAIEPADYDVLRQLAGECHQEGNFAAVMGYAVAVRYEFQAELVLLERLSRDRPEDHELLRARADAHHELARRARFDGDQEAVRREQQAEVALLRQLALADPETGDLLREAMTGAGKAPAEARPVPAEAGGAEEQVATLKALVERARAADDGVTARAGLQALILMRERAVAARPGDAGALKDLAEAHRELGRQWASDGDSEAARREDLAEVAVLRQLALADPQTGDLLREAMGGDGTEGSAGAPGEPGLAAGRPGRAPADAGPRAVSGLAGTGPEGLPPDAEDRIRNLTGLAERARAVGDGENLRTSLQALVMLRERMAAGRPGEMAAQLDLAGVHRELGDCYAGSGQDDAAYRSSQAEVAVLALLAAADPSDVDRLNALASAYGVLSDRAHAAEYPVAARAAAQAEVLIRGWLVTFHPVSWRQEALDEAQRRLARLPRADPPPGGLLSS
jgi:tetratricopeptide (TPR) repeat protein